MNAADMQGREEMGLTMLYIGKHLKMFQVEAHSHDYYEMVYCTGGSGSFETGHERVTYGEGDLVIIPKGLSHTNTSQDGFSNIYSAVALMPVRPDRLRVIRDNESRDIFRTLDQFYRYFHSDIIGRTAILKGLEQIIEAFIDSFSDMERYSNMVEQITKEIIDRFSDSSFSARDALENTGFSIEYARKQFIRERHVSPQIFLRTVRLEHAAKLLASRGQYGLNIAQIAEACGYSDQLYFSRVFRDFYGESPSQYG